MSPCARCIVKFRQIENRQSTPETRGVLRKELAPEFFHLELFEPHPELKPWIEYYWSVAWDLGDDRFEQVVVTNPAIDLSFEDDVAGNGFGPSLMLTGVSPRNYKRVLRGRAEVFAVHFQPAMFRPWWTSGMSSLTNTVVRLDGNSGPGIPWVAHASACIPRLFARTNNERAVLLDRLFLDHLPTPDGVAESIRDTINEARHDRSLWDVAEMARLRNVSERTNQRQFTEYVGVGPKWISSRYRIQAAIDILDLQRTKGVSADAGGLSRLAADLGYFDQAHFNKDFRFVTGLNPESYRNPP